MWPCFACGKGLPCSEGELCHLLHEHSVAAKEGGGVPSVLRGDNSRDWLPMHASFYLYGPRRQVEHAVHRLRHIPAAPLGPTLHMISS